MSQALCRALVYGRGSPSGQSIVDMAPMVRRCVDRVGAHCVDLIDLAQDTTDVWPAGDAEQDFPAEPDERQRGIGLAGRHCAQDTR
jgi:hypothetical protein